MVSQRAPSWSGIAVIDLKMQELSSQDFSGKYLVLLFYPCDFSFVCPTELIQFSDRVSEFRTLGNNKLNLYLPANNINIVSRQKIFVEKIHKKNRLEINN